MSLSFKLMNRKVTMIGHICGISILTIIKVVIEIFSTNYAVTFHPKGAQRKSTLFQGACMSSLISCREYIVSK